MAQLVKNSARVGDLGSIPELGRSPGKGNRCPLQYSGLGNSMDYSMGSWRVGHDWVTFTFISDWQCCVSFRCTAKWFSYTYTYLSILFKLFSHLGCYITLQSSLCYTVNPCWLSILNTAVHTCIIDVQLSQHSLPNVQSILSLPSTKPTMFSIDF